MFQRKKSITQKCTLPTEYIPLEKQLTDVISYAKGYQNIEISTYDILCEWYEKKSHIINGLLGGNLIYELPEMVTIELTQKEKDEIFKRFIAELEADLTDNSDDFLDFVTDNKDGFFSNTVVNPSKAYEKTVRVQKGDKLLKTFKYFVNNDNKLRYYQDLASKYIQQSKLSGYLCLSVHPLDFMTLSENNCGWRSCHALDGEYAAGNISLMIDPSTIVCYLKTGKDEQLKCFPQGMLWNSKIWRVLAHISANHTALWFSKQYPFSNRKLINDIYRKILHGFSYPNPCGVASFIDSAGQQVDIPEQHLIYLHGKFQPVHNYVHQVHGALNFNDLTTSFQGCPAILSYSTNLLRSGGHFDFNVTVGGVFKPLCGCNKDFNEGTIGEDFVCEDCREKTYGDIKRCECCNAIVYDELALYYSKETGEYLTVCSECKKYLDRL